MRTLLLDSSWRHGFARLTRKWVYGMFVCDVCVLKNVLIFLPYLSTFEPRLSTLFTKIRINASANGIYLSIYVYT